MNMKIESFSAEETYELGKKLGSEANPGDVLTLIGDLGVGKTVFTQGFADGLGIGVLYQGIFISLFTEMV